EGTGRDRDGAGSARAAGAAGAAGAVVLANGADPAAGDFGARRRPGGPAASIRFLGPALGGGGVGHPVCEAGARREVVCAASPAGGRAAAEGGAVPLEPAPGLTLLPMATPAGTVLHTDRLYPPDHIHGRLPLDGPLHVPGRAWRRLLPVVHGFPMEDAVFVDLETTGLSRGAGTYAFLIGVGRFAEGRFRLRQFFLRDFHEEPAVMAALAAELETARALVTFNGRSFDWPLLETRAAMNRLRL